MSLRSFKEKILRNKEHFLTVSFILGFVVDNFTLNRVDQLFDNIVILTYLTLAMLSLLVLYAATAGKFPERINNSLRDFSPLLTQYALGGLFSGMLIFYGRSGSWVVSWPFLFLMLLIIYGNETIRDRVQRLLYNIGMLFVGLFSYVVLIVPVLLGEMGALVFVGSGILALIIILMFIRVLAWIVPRFIYIHQRSLLLVVGLIFAGFNFLYFTNIIPPIPLSLKEVGIFHSVVRFEDGSYQLSYEGGTRWQFYKKSDDVFRGTPGATVFCFAKVFAPTSIKTDIYHTWEYYSQTERKWIEHAHLSYSIVGGRDGGYRGYTYIQSSKAGQWRCTVETERGQVLGRENFTIDTSTPAGTLVTRRE